MLEQPLDKASKERIRLARIRAFFDNAKGNPVALFVAGAFFASLMYDEGSGRNTLLIWVALLFVSCAALYLFGRHVERIGLTEKNAFELFILRCILGAFVASLFAATAVLLPENASRTAYCFVLLIAMTVVASGYLFCVTAFWHGLVINVFSLFPLSLYFLYRFLEQYERFFLLLGIAAILWQIVFALRAFRVSQSVVGEIEAQERLNVEMLERRATEQALRVSEARAQELASMLRRVCDNVPDMIWAKDLEGRYLFVNRAFSECITGSPDTEAPVGRTFESYVEEARRCHPDDPQWYSLGEFSHDIDEHARSREEPTVYDESGNVRGKFLFLDIHLARFLNAQGEVVGTVGSARDITERKASEEYVRRLAYHDALTDLPNRLLLNDRMHQALAQAGRDRGKAAVLFIDLDRLKPVNDALGHDVGDLLLKEVARRLLAVVMRRADTVSRLGGDEFVVLLQRINHEQDAEVIARKIIEALDAPFVIADHDIRISASVGIAIFPSDGEEVSQLLKHADLAMYAAKHEGGDGFRLFDKSMGHE